MQKYIYICKWVPFNTPSTYIYKLHFNNNDIHIYNNKHNTCNKTTTGGTGSARSWRSAVSSCGAEYCAGDSTATTERQRDASPTTELYPGEKQLAYWLNSYLHSKFLFKLDFYKHYRNVEFVETLYNDQMVRFISCFFFISRRSIPHLAR